MSRQIATDLDFITDVLGYNQSYMNRMALFHGSRHRRCVSLSVKFVTLLIVGDVLLCVSHCFSNTVVVEITLHSGDGVGNPCLPLTTFLSSYRYYR